MSRRRSSDITDPTFFRPVVISGLVLRPSCQPLVHTQPGEDDSAVESVVVDRAIPVIDRILRRRCRDWTGGLDVLNDLRAEVLVRLLTRLRGTADESSVVIEDFDGYVAGIAFRVVDDAVRVWRPEW